MVDSKMAPSRNVEDRRSPLYSILEALMSPRGPMTRATGTAAERNAAEPENLPAVPRLIPGNPPFQPAGDMPGGMMRELYDEAAGSPPMAPPGVMRTQPIPAARMDGVMSRIAPRLNGGSGGDVRGMAANDMLNATPAPRADAGGGVAPRAAAPTGFTMADVDAARQFIASRTIHYRMGDESEAAHAAAFNLNPIAAVRAANLISAGEAATGKSAIVTEAWRSDATQAVYKANRTGKPVLYNGQTYLPDTYVNDAGKTVTRKTSYPTAGPGKSNHREGGALDFSEQGGAGAVRTWMRRHSSEFGFQPIRGDDPHLQVNENVPLSAEEADYVVKELGYADVRDYQAKNGLDPDGVVGKDTTRSMLAAVSAPSIEAALDPSAKPYTVYSSDIYKAEKEGTLNARAPLSVADAFNYVPGEQPGAAQESLIAANDTPVDYDSTVIAPDIPKISAVSFAEEGGAPAAPAAPVPRLRSDVLAGAAARDRLTPEQGTQTGDRSMSQRPRLNNQAGDRTMMQRPLDAQFSVVLDKVEAGQPLTDADKAIVAAWQEQGGEPNEPIVQRARELLGPHPNEVAATPLKPDGTPYDQPPGTVPAGDRPPRGGAPTADNAPVPRLRSTGLDYANVATPPDRPVSGLPAKEEAAAREPSASELAAADRTPQPPVPRLRSDAPAPTPNRRTIASGDKGPEVTELQKKLAAAMPGLPSDFVDGKYGPYTEGVVMALQERAARTDPTFKVDGIVGDQTWPLIDAAIARIPTPTTRENAIGMRSFDPLAGARPVIPRLTPAPDPLGDKLESKFLASDLGMDRKFFEANTGQINANGQPVAPFRSNASPPAISGGTDVLSGFRGTSLVPRLTSGRSGPPIRIASSAPTVAKLPQGMNDAAFPGGNWLDQAHDYVFSRPSGISTAGEWAGIMNPPATEARTPRQLSLDAMPGSATAINNRFGDAFTPVTPSSTTAPPPAPRLAPAGATVAPTASGTPGAASPPAGGGVAGVYSGGGPTGGAPATYSSSSSGSGPGAGGGTSAPGSTASTGSSGGTAPPSYYDSSRGGWQSWNSSTNSYQSTGVV